MLKVASRVIIADLFVAIAVNTINIYNVAIIITIFELFAKY